MKRFRTILILLAAVLTAGLGVRAEAAKAGDPYYSKWYYENEHGNMVRCGTYLDASTIQFIPNETGEFGAHDPKYYGPNYNYHCLNDMLAEEGQLTIVIPSGSNFKINGPLIPSSSKTIIATGAAITMKPKTYVMMTDPREGLHDITVKGGKWRSPDEGGRKGSMFQFAFAKNITLDGIDVEANFDGHCVEIIACENVTVKNSKIRAVGSNPKNCKEEQVQIDISTKKTAPKVAEYGAQYVTGQTCRNITVLNNDIYGARSVGVNYYSGYKDHYHENIVIKNNRLHATTSEGIQYFNVIGGEISGNKIRTDATRKTSNYSYTIAVHIQNNGKAPEAMANSRILVKSNTIFGNRNGIYIKGYNVKSKTDAGRFGTVEICSNKVYCKKGKSAAIAQTKGSCRKLINKSNKKYKWTKKTKVTVNLKK